MNALNQSNQSVHTRRQVVWVLLLWLLVLVSALAITYSAFDMRNKFNELEQLRAQQDAFHIEWGKYLLEESAWASFERIEKIATDQLSMVVPSVQQIVVVARDE